MKVSVNSYNGMTGSEKITGMYTYLSTASFTTENLPRPTHDNIAPTSSMTIPLPRVEVPCWFMVAYRGEDNQMFFGPTRPVMEYSAKMSAIFSKAPGFIVGDPINGAMRSVVYSESFTMNAFETSSQGQSTAWENPNAIPSVYVVDGKMIGVTSVVNNGSATAREIYMGGYMAKSGDMTDIYPDEFFGLLGPPMEQGRTITRTLSKWQAWIPTLEEFRKYMGAIFLTGIPTDVAPLSVYPMENTYYLTSTPWPDDPMQVTAINPVDNTLMGLYPYEVVSAQLLFEFTPV